MCHASAVISTFIQSFDSGAAQRFPPIRPKVTTPDFGEFRELELLDDITALQFDDASAGSMIVRRGENDKTI
jgi:hypothetical protein